MTEVPAWIASRIAIGAFQPNHFYKAGDIIDVGHVLYEANADFVSAPAFNAADWTVLTGQQGAQGAAGATGSVGPEAPVGTRVSVPVTDQLMDPAYVAEPGASGHASATYKKLYKALIDTVPGTATLTYSNTGLLGANGGSTVTVKTALLFPDGTIVNITWDGGAANKVIAPGARATCDPIPDRAFAAGDVFWVLTYVTSNVVGNWPHLSVGGWVQYDADKTDNTGNWTAAGAPNCYGPSVIAAVPTRRVRAVAVVGDSQLAASSSTNFVEDVLQPGAVPTVRLASSGDSFAGVNSGTASRFELGRGCSDWLFELGTNDLGTGGTTAATIKARMIVAWTNARTYGAKRVFQMTIPPRNGGTAGAQTQVGSNAARIDINDWLRDGAPILAGVAVATGSNAAGTLRAGDSGHPLTDYEETADAIETFRNSGYQRAAYFNDGTHFNAAGQKAWGAALNFRRYDGLPTYRKAQTREWRKSQWLYPPHPFQTLSAQSLVNRRLYLRPFIHDVADRVSGRLWAYCTNVAVGASVVRFMYFNSQDADGLPGTLLWDGGADNVANFPGMKAAATWPTNLSADDARRELTKLRTDNLYYIGIMLEGNPATPPKFQCGVGQHPLLTDAWFPGAGAFGYLRACLAYDLGADGAPATLVGSSPIGGETFCPLVAAEPT